MTSEDGDKLHVSGERIDSGVAGLVIVPDAADDRGDTTGLRSPTGAGRVGVARGGGGHVAWRLVHAHTGRPLSRSAVHRDPEALRELASLVAPLADWSQHEIDVPGPRLRQGLHDAVAYWSDTHPARYRTAAAPSPATAPRPAPARPANARPVRSEESPALRRLVRHLYSSLPPGLLGSTVRRLEPRDRQLLLDVVSEFASDDTTGVLQVVRPTRENRVAGRHGTEPTGDEPTNRGAPGPGLAAG